MNHFPIYLDSASMSKTLPVAREAFLNAPFGNPSSEHAIGQNARNALEQAREKIAACIGATPEQIIFTSGSTEACNIAINSMPAAFRRCSPYEHHAVLDGGDFFSKMDVSADLASVADEAATITRFQYEASQYLRNSLTVLRDLRMVAMAQMLANNETGEIYTLPKKQNLGDIPDLVFSDLTAACGHIPLSVSALDIDFGAFGSHKFGGVPGAGVLYAKDPSILSPLIRGGGQERGMRSGTENVPAICAMAAALEWQTEHMAENTAKLSKLSEIMQTELSKIDGILWNTPLDKPRLPHILNASFPGVNARALALLLSKEGVMVSPGAACSNGKSEPSHVIMSMFHDEARARSAIRISFSHENTEIEVSEAAEKIKNAVAYLRSIG